MTKGAAVPSPLSDGSTSMLFDGGRACALHDSHLMSFLLVVPGSPHVGKASGEGDASQMCGPPLGVCKACSREPAVVQIGCASVQPCVVQKSLFFEAIILNI